MFTPLGLFKGIARQADLFLARACVRCVGEKNGLVVLVFHGVASDEQEIARGVLDPRYCLTLAEVRLSIEYFLRHGYAAVSPRDILGGFRADRRYVMFSFDDGYFNNSRVLPILESYRVPALFSIPSDYVSTGKAFWWDVLFRDAGRRGRASRTSAPKLIA